MNLFQYVEQNYSKFTKREKLIADYLLLKERRILNMSAKEISEITGTSAPTVVRFSKKLGFNSLNEMKLSLSISFENNKSDKKFEYLDEDLSVRNIINGIRQTFKNIVDVTSDLIKEDELEKAIEILINAKCIYIFGVGVSGLVGLDFYYKLSRIGKRCVYHNDAHLQVTSSVLIEKDDVALVISYSGETREVILCAENIKKNNVKLISITKASIDNKLSNISDITLNVPYVEKSLREGAISSRISQLAIIDMLFIGMAKNNLKDIEDKLVITRNAVSELK
ncbi:MAG TPA: MurR/RpiR family transcriptional regulator [Candidatus Dwaynia gallinarum]|nr:MurR/RpiR family transcriptional regulator [Candidatus Dwaynia gallinarum]